MESRESLIGHVPYAHSCSDHFLKRALEAALLYYNLLQDLTLYVVSALLSATATTLARLHCVSAVAKRSTLLTVGVFAIYLSFDV